MDDPGGGGRATSAGFLSAGGSCGALAGPTLTALLAAPLGTANLLLVSCGFLGLALVCIYALIRRAGAVLGAVGVSGAKPDQDLDCAEHGLKRVLG